MQKVIIILYVRDQNRSKAFYEAILATSPILDVPGMTEFPLTDTSILGLMPENGIATLLGDAVPHPAKGNGIPRCELYLLVADPAVVYERLIAAGGKGISPPAPRPWGDVAAYGVDPDGHIVAFARTVGKT